MYPKNPNNIFGPMQTFSGLKNPEAIPQRPLEPTAGPKNPIELDPSGGLVFPLQGFRVRSLGSKAHRSWFYSSQNVRPFTAPWCMESLRGCQTTPAFATNKPCLIVVNIQRISLTRNTFQRRTQKRHPLFKASGPSKSQLVKIGCCNQKIWNR